MTARFRTAAQPYSVRSLLEIEVARYVTKRVDLKLYSITVEFNIERTAK